MNLKTDLGVQSYCFRHFKENERVAQMVRECGLDKIELCAVHADFADPDSFEQVIETYRSAGVEIVSIGVQTAHGDVATERKYFECARQAGARHISVHFGVQSFPASYRVTEQLCAEFDTVVGIHNHGGYHWLGNSEMLARVFNDTNQSIGLCLDTAWALDAGQHPVGMATSFNDRLYGAHIKDFVFDRARRPEDVVVGTGNLDLPAFAKLLENSPKLRFCVLEYEGDFNNPVPVLKQCVAAVRAATQ